MHCYCQLPLKVMLLLIKTWVQKVFREFNIKIIDEGEPFLYIFDKMIATSGITNNKNLFFFFWQTNNLHCYFQIQTLKED